ncbi:MAG: hypothetical protein PHY48_14435 [Candidatus Cloacimonetes bacterium]|nr:hypothetical protein [Candidatus Cloacimonadota bacterium]
MSMILTIFSILTPIIGLFGGYTSTSSRIVYVIGACIMVRGLNRSDRDEVGVGFGFMMAIAVVVAIDFLSEHFSIILK